MVTSCNIIQPRNETLYTLCHKSTRKLFSGQMKQHLPWIPSTHNHTYITPVDRRSDVNKAGVLGRDEIASAMRSVDIPVDQAVIDRLLAKCNTKGMSFQDFRDQLWIDDRMTVVIDERKNARAGSRGDNSGAKYLWSPIKGPQAQRYVGAFNDTLEADRIAAGLIPPRLDSNFSSVQYDILTLDQQPQSIDPLVHVPVKNRPYLYDPPAPAGRRVAYDKGEYPYDVVSLRSRAVDSVGQEGKSILFQVPVRVVTFARLHRGDYPTQQAHMLTNTAV